MPNPRIFAYSFTISKDVIDENGQVNNVAYVQWMQDAATIRHPETVKYRPPHNAT